uniref:Uncharacterized protein n=1 Tax=Romanomermis culicivorax TaxID=13658 RepID=A0A915IKV2_ROMCU
MSKGFLGGAGAVPPLANAGIGVIIPTRAQQKWPGSIPNTVKEECLFAGNAGKKKFHQSRLLSSRFQESYPIPARILPRECGESGRESGSGSCAHPSPGSML